MELLLWHRCWSQHKFSWTSNLADFSDWAGTNGFDDVSMAFQGFLMICVSHCWMSVVVKLLCHPALVAIPFCPHPSGSINRQDCTLSVDSNCWGVCTHVNTSIGGTCECIELTSSWHPKSRAHKSKPIQNRSDINTDFQIEAWQGGSMAACRVAKLNQVPCCLSLLLYSSTFIRVYSMTSILVHSCNRSIPHSFRRMQLWHHKSKHHKASRRAYDIYSLVDPHQTHTWTRTKSSRHLGASHTVHVSVYSSHSKGLREVFDDQITELIWRAQQEDHWYIDTCKMYGKIYDAFDICYVWWFLIDCWIFVHVNYL